MRELERRPWLCNVGYLLSVEAPPSSSRCRKVGEKIAHARARTTRGRKEILGRKEREDYVEGGLNKL